MLKGVRPKGGTSLHSIKDSVAVGEDDKYLQNQNLIVAIKKNHKRLSHSLVDNP